MKLLISTLHSLALGSCGAVLLIFLGVHLDKRPWWSWMVAAIALLVIWESMKQGIANAVAKKMAGGSLLLFIAALTFTAPLAMLRW